MHPDTPAPLILTLAMDHASFQWLDGLRRRHFPAERNVVPAHLTLFHHLPGREVEAVCAILQSTALRHAALPLHIEEVRFLGRGVAFGVGSEALRELRRELAELWSGWLTPQDRQPFRPHVTIQNKVQPEVARALFEELRASLAPISGYGEGLILWEYLGGPWRKVQQFPFVRRGA